MNLQPTGFEQISSEFIYSISNTLKNIRSFIFNQHNPITIWMFFCTQHWIIFTRTLHKFVHWFNFKLCFRFNKFEFYLPKKMILLKKKNKLLFSFFFKKNKSVSKNSVRMFFLVNFVGFVDRRKQFLMFVLKFSLMSLLMSSLMWWLSKWNKIYCAKLVL